MAPWGTYHTQSGDAIIEAQTYRHTLSKHVSKETDTEIVDGKSDNFTSS